MSVCVSILSPKNISETENFTKESCKIYRTLAIIRHTYEILSFFGATFIQVFDNFLIFKPWKLLLDATFIRVPIVRPTECYNMTENEVFYYVRQALLDCHISFDTLLY